MHILNYLKHKKNLEKVVLVPMFTFHEMEYIVTFRIFIIPEQLFGASNRGFKLIIFTLLQIAWNLVLLKFMNDSIYRTKS